MLATVAENDCHGMIVVESEKTNVAFVSIDTTGVISDESNKHVEVDQVYKERSILKAVMERCAIKERFQYKTTRSNSSRYCASQIVSFKLYKCFYCIVQTKFVYYMN